MRLRFAVLALVLVAAVSGCGSDDKKNASSESPASTPAASESLASLDPSDVDTAKCAQFFAGQAKAAELSSKLTPGSDVSAAIEAANEQFEALKQGAPADIQEALDKVRAAYTLLGKLYKDPASMSASAAELQEATKDLQENALKLNNWIIQNCS